MQDHVVAEAVVRRVALSLRDAVEEDHPGFVSLWMRQRWESA
jgi:hypothetical protein